jgi:hypothetical protein
LSKIFRGSVKWRGEPVELTGRYSIGCTAF